jgi:predicted membrane channel-forming protein YqfA (hemolysin III family)
MNNRLYNWPEQPHPVIAVMLAVAICAVPILLPHFRPQDMPANLFAYAGCCIIAYPFAALLRRRVTTLPGVWVAAVLLLLAACFYHTNIIVESANLPWPQRRDVTLDKFLFNLPQVTIGVVVWWLLVLRPDQRRQ